MTVSVLDELIEKFQTYVDSREKKKDDAAGRKARIYKEKIGLLAEKRDLFKKQADNQNNADGWLRQYYLEAHGAVTTILTDMQRNDELIELRSSMKSALEKLVHLGSRFLRWIFRCPKQEKSHPGRFFRSTGVKTASEAERKWVEMSFRCSG